jgi:CRISPR-associated protein Cas1
MEQHLNDHFQVCAAALCLEERTGRTITYGEIFYHANLRRQTVAFTPQLRQITEQVMAGVHVAGLDPYIGYLHEVHHGQPAMVLDLMEEFRALIGDNLVLSLLHKHEIKPEDFHKSLGAYRLKDNARKTFLQAFDKKMNDEFKHSVFDYRCTYRRAIELQARLLSRHLQEGIPYKPLSLR